MDDSSLGDEVKGWRGGGGGLEGDSGREGRVGVWSVDADGG